MNVTITRSAIGKIANVDVDKEPLSNETTENEQWEIIRFVNDNFLVSVRIC